MISQMLFPLLFEAINTIQASGKQDNFQLRDKILHKQLTL
jgi:hypothetical protein